MYSDSTFFSVSSFGSRTCQQRAADSTCTYEIFISRCNASTSANAASSKPKKPRGSLACACSGRFKIPAIRQRSSTASAGTGARTRSCPNSRSHSRPCHTTTTPTTTTTPRHASFSTPSQLECQRPAFRSSCLGSVSVTACNHALFSGGRPINSSSRRPRRPKWQW